MAYVVVACIGVVYIIMVYVYVVMVRQSRTDHMNMYSVLLRVLRHESRESPLGEKRTVMIALLHGAERSLYGWPTCVQACVRTCVQTCAQTCTAGRPARVVVA